MTLYSTTGTSCEGMLVCVPGSTLAWVAAKGHSWMRRCHARIRGIRGSRGVMPNLALGTNRPHGLSCRSCAGRVTAKQAYTYKDITHLALTSYGLTTGQTTWALWSFCRQYHTELTEDSLVCAAIDDNDIYRQPSGAPLKGCKSYF